MVSLFSSLSSTDLKKIAFSDQLVSSQRRKVVSPCSFGIVLFFIVLSALLFSVSSKGPFIQGLYNLGSRGNGSFVSWRNPGAFGGSANASGGSGSAPDLRFPLNETLDSNATLANFGGGEKVLGSVPVVNQSVSFEERSFIVEGSVGVDVDSRNGSQSLENSVDSLKNESVSDVGKGVLGGGCAGNCSSNGGNGDLRNEGKNASAPAASDRSFKKCDIFNGRWVRDDAEPYYPPGSCPYIDRDFDCHLNGRPDSEYVKWRWQPYDCDIPR